MPENGSSTEYRITLHRVGDKRQMFDAPGFTSIVTATSPEDAIRQAEDEASQQGGQFKVVDIRPAGSASTPATSD